MKTYNVQETAAIMKRVDELREAKRVASERALLAQATAEADSTCYACGRSKSLRRRT